MPHINDKIDFTVTTYIVCDGKVLLRKHDKYKKWLGVGGHIEPDQDPIETVYKEVKEEAGLDVEVVADPTISYPEDDEEVDHGKDLQLPIFINRHRINPTHEHIDLIYATKSNSMDIKPDEGEASDPNTFRWVTLDELEKLEDISERTRLHASTALKKVLNH